MEEAQFYFNLSAHPILTILFKSSLRTFEDEILKIFKNIQPQPLLLTSFQDVNSKYSYQKSKMYQAKVERPPNNTKVEVFEEEEGRNQWSIHSYRTHSKRELVLDFPSLK